MIDSNHYCEIKRTVGIKRIENVTGEICLSFLLNTHSKMFIVSRCLKYTIFV